MRLYYIIGEKQKGNIEITSKGWILGENIFDVAESFLTDLLNKKDVAELLTKDNLNNNLYSYLDDKVFTYIGESKEDVLETFIEDQLT